MYFFVDLKDQAITAHSSLANAAKTAHIKLTGQPLPQGVDPVHEVKKLFDGNGILLNISGAFESIENSEGKAAQELAGDFKRAVDRFYE